MKAYLPASGWSRIGQRARGMFNLNDSRWGRGDDKPGEEGKSAAFRRQMFGDGGAETNAGAGHQGDTAGQLQIHVQLPRKKFTGPETIALPAIVKDGV